MKILHVKPAELDGKPMVIRNPATGLPIPAHGVSVEAKPFWTTALRVGDVVPTTAEAIAAAEAAAQAATDQPTPEAEIATETTPAGRRTKAKE